MPLLAGRTPYLSLLKALDIATIKKNLSFVGYQLMLDGKGTSFIGLWRSKKTQIHLNYCALKFRMSTYNFCDMEEHQRQQYLNQERKCFCSAADL